MINKVVFIIYHHLDYVKVCYMDILHKQVISILVK